MEKDDNATICTALDDLWKTTTDSLKLSVSTMKLIMNNKDSELLNNAIEAINKILVFEDDHQGALKFKSLPDNDSTSKKSIDSSRNNKNEAENDPRARKVLADITHDAPLPIWKNFSTSRRHYDKENIPIPQYQIKEKLKKVTQMYTNEYNQSVPNGQVQQHHDNDYNNASPSSSSSTTTESPNNSLSSSGTISCSCSIFDIADIIKEFPIIGGKSDNIIENTTTSSSSTGNIKSSSTSFIDTDNIKPSTSSIDASGNSKSITSFTESNTEATKSRFTEIITDNIKSDISASSNAISDNTKTEVFGDEETRNIEANNVTGDDQLMGANIDEKQKQK